MTSTMLESSQKKYSLLHKVKHFFVLLGKTRKYGLKRSYIIFINMVIHEFRFLMVNLRKEKFISFVDSLETKKPLIIYPPFMSWNIPMLQRPNHFATVLAANNYEFLYFSNCVFDNISLKKKIGEKLHIVNQHYYPLIEEYPAKKCFILHPNAQNYYNVEILENHLEKNNLIIYDYLDHPDVFNLDDLSTHEFIMKNEKIIILCSARALLKDAFKYRSKNVYYVPNAAYPMDFQKTKPNEILKNISDDHFLMAQEILSKKKKVIGYFGAIAKWFDYSLIEKLAQKFGEDVHIILIGQNYDGSLDNCGIDFEAYKNISFLGTIHYSKLKFYASLFSCSIIPFISNDITASTSPIKLFEYMNIGAPIVCSDLPECRQYETAFVAKDHDEFLTLVEKALHMPKNDPYFTTLKKEAMENTWDARAKLIIEAIHENLN